MENNEISMFMDVKLDINERKSESSKFKSWTKCLVKIEAIKCFPCYIRLTFIKELQNDDDTDFCVRINIPGITIRQAASRTKNFSYGIFWKQNRKSSCIFFALDSQISYERHMKWMKKSVKNLELHRQEFIETRRNSKYNIDCGIKSIQKRKCKNNENSHKTNLQYILGPLPKIPDSSDSYDWSKRVSGFSEIYEEIPDTFEQYQQQNKRNSRRVSRASVASGIYEEMKPTQNSNFEPIRETEKISEEVPPLPPPRKRINTLEENDDNHHEIPRCNTNPEIEMAKKKKYLQVLETVFGRSKRCDSVSEGKVSTKDDLILNTPKDTNKNNRNPSNGGNSCSGGSVNNKVTKCKNNRFFGLSRTCKKRNSFSSPDLTNLNDCFNDEFEDFVFIDSLSLEYDDANETSVCSVVNKNSSGLSDDEKSNEIDVNDQNSDDTILLRNHNDLNISDKIQSSFNFSCNSSTINLVGANLNSIIQLDNKDNNCQREIKLIDDLSGYCIMAPIKNKSPKKFDYYNDEDIGNENDKENKKTSSESIVKDICPSNTNEICDGARKNSMDSCIYENMYPVIEFSLLEKNNENHHIKKFENEIEQKSQQHIYQNVIIDIANHAAIYKAKTLSPKNSGSNDIKVATIITENCIDENDRNSSLVSRKSINFDEKIPSYYPNNYCDIGKCNRRSINSLLSSSQSSSNTNTSSNSEELKSQLKHHHHYIKTNKKSNNNQNNDKKCNSSIINTQKKQNENSYISSSSSSSSSSQINIENKKNIILKNNDDNDKFLPSSLIIKNGKNYKSISPSKQLTVIKSDKIDENNIYHVTKTKQQKNSLSMLEIDQKSNLKIDQTSIMENSLSSSLSSPSSTPSISSLVPPEHKKLQNKIQDDLQQQQQQHQKQQHKHQYNLFNKKYATLTRLTTPPPSSHKYLDKTSSSNKKIFNSNDLSSLKKFASLPRLKKMDFSPLKLKINAVLQRHQSDGFQT